MQSPDEVAQRPNTANRRLVALAVFILFLGAQLAWSLLSDREPYPVVKMPSFALQAETEGTVLSRPQLTTITYEDGTVITPAVRELMGEDFRYSAVGPSYDYAFRPENNAGGKGALSDPEMISWLSSRAQVLNEKSEVVSMEFCWKDTRLDIATGQPVSTQPCEIMRLDF